MGGDHRGSAVAVSQAALLAEAGVKEEQRLLALAASVHPDGREAVLTLHTSTGSFPLVIDHENLAAIHAEIQAAAALMLYRQTLRPDDGADGFADSFRAALRPDDCSVAIDSKTADRLFLLQFRDRLPLTIRMTPDAVADSLDQLTTLSRLTAN